MNHKTTQLGVRSHALLKSMMFLIMTTCMSLGALADDYVLQVWQSDGQVVAINLNEEPRTTYSDGNLIITTTQTTITYPLERVRRYTYVLSSDGINSPTIRVEFSIDGETLTITGMKQGSTVMLYNTTGQLLRSISTTAQGKVTVSVSQLPTGIYVVKANGATYKITKK